MKKQNGITLIVLVVTVVLLLILIGLGVTYSRKSIDDMKFNQFSSELKVVESRLNVISKEIKMGSTAYGSIGTPITSDAVTNGHLSQGDYNKALEILNTPGMNIPPGEINNFILLTSDDLNTIGINKINQDMLVNYNIPKAVSFTGITINGTVYYSY